MIIRDRYNNIIEVESNDTLIDDQIASMPPPEPTPEERIATLEEQNEMLTGCILELSELLYN